MRVFCGVDFLTGLGLDVLASRGSDGRVGALRAGGAAGRIGRSMGKKRSEMTVEEREAARVRDRSYVVENRETIRQKKRAA